MLLSQSGLSRGLAAVLFAVVLCVIFFWPNSTSYSSSAKSGSSVLEHAQHPISVSAEDRLGTGDRNAHVKATVVASMDGDDTSWLHDYFPDWHHNIYTADDPSASLTVPINKGRESQVYLTYIIDNYHDLPEYMVFLHALRYQWHNEDPMYDGVFPLRNLQLPYVNKMGYANMRCTWLMGCPAELHPAKAVSDPGYRKWDRDKERVATEKAYAEAHSIIFPDSKTPPESVGVPCGAQFAVARWRVLERPLADYQRIRDWLTRTHMPDSVSGRILEYTWHMIMGMPSVSCPTAEECFCQKFGKCNLTCPDDSKCNGRYKLPTYSNLPPYWPEFGAGRDGFPALDWWKEFE